MGAIRRFMETHFLHFNSREALGAAVAGTGERLLLLVGKRVGKEVVVGVECSEPLQGDSFVDIDAGVPSSEDPLPP